MNAGRAEAAATAASYRWLLVWVLVLVLVPVSHSSVEWLVKRVVLGTVEMKEQDVRYLRITWLPNCLSREVATPVVSHW